MNMHLIEKPPLSTWLSKAFATITLAVAFTTLPAIISARAAVEIQEVTSDSGITAWLVEDYTVPIISVRFSFKGGSTQDPAGKEGISNLMSGLFDEGAGDLDADAFQTRRDATYGQMRLLAEERENAFELMKMAVTSPRFDQEPVDRIRGQLNTGIQRDMRDPNALGMEKFAQALYGDHPYARRSDGTIETLGSVTPDDLRALHKRTFARSNLNVAVVGAIDAETLKSELDRIFGDLPQEADLVKIDRVTPKLDQEVNYPYALPQATLQLVYPGLERDDPEFFPAFIMNHVLGGGTFSSRLFNEVREKRGLAYGVGSGLQTSDYADSLIIGTSTRTDRVQEALDVILEQVKKVADEGITDAELATAKTYLIGAYPINNLDSSSAVASTLLELQKEKRGIDYIDRRVGYIEAVTKEQVKAAAQRLLTAKPAVLIIGPDLARKAD
jgi:zinc protease